jgi:hypothetical protein
VFTVLPHVIVR